MNVAELIEQLKKLPADSEIVIWDDEYYHFDKCVGAQEVSVSVRDNGRHAEVVEVWERDNPKYPNDRSMRVFNAVELTTVHTLMDNSKHLHSIG